MGKIDMFSAPKDGGRQRGSNGHPYPGRAHGDHELPDAPGRPVARAGQQNSGLRRSFAKCAVRLSNDPDTLAPEHAYQSSAVDRRLERGYGRRQVITSVNLALSLSREGNQNVFLIDLDMRRPTIAKYLGISPKRGVQDYFDGHVDAASIFFRIGAPGLVVAVATESRDNSSELLSSDRLPQLIDYVFTVDPKAVLLLDMPPLLVADDALAVAPRVDAILLVATEGKTKRSDLAGAIELVQQLASPASSSNRSAESVARYY